VQALDYAFGVQCELAGDTVADGTRKPHPFDRSDTLKAEQVLPLMYSALRKLAAAMLARERPGHTLQPTALVHEAYVRLVEDKKLSNWQSRGHFFSAAAKTMRRILVELARQKTSLKHGGEYVRVEMDLDRYTSGERQTTWSPSMTH
jgi:RNA polymerase sigma factor (TIGR02999 family)